MASNEPSLVALWIKEKTEYLLQTGRTFRDEIVGAATEVYRGVLRDDEGLPDLGFVHDLDLRVLDLSTDDYVGAAQERQEAKVAHREANDGAREQTNTAADEQRALKRKLIGRHGKRGVRSLGMDTNPVTNPRGALQQLRHTLSVVEDEENVEWPPALRRRKPADRARIAGDLREIIGDLEPAIDQAAKAGKKSEETMLRRDRLRVIQNQRYVGVSRHIEGRLRMAGLNDVADRLRLSRRSRPAANAEEPTPQPPDHQPSPDETPQTDDGVLSPEPLTEV